MKFRKIIDLYCLVLLSSVISACGGGGGGGGSDSGDTPEPTPTPTPTQTTVGLLVTTERDIPSPIRVDVAGVILTQHLTAVNNLDQQIKLQTAVTDASVIISAIDVPTAISVTQIMDDDNACRSGSSLELLQSCVLSYEIKLKDQTPQQVNDQIIIHTNSQTTPEIVIPVVFEAKAVTSNNFSHIGYDGVNAEPRFTLGGHYRVAVKNTTQRTMHYLNLVVADWLMPYITNLVATTNNGHLAPGQSAILSFDIKDDEAALNAIKMHASAMLGNAVNGNVLKVVSADAMDMLPSIIPLANPLLMEESMLDFTMPSDMDGDKTVVLTNASNKDIQIKSLSFIGVTGVMVADNSDCKEGRGLLPGKSCTLQLHATESAKVGFDEITHALHIDYQLASNKVELSQQLNIDVAKTTIASDDIVDIFYAKRMDEHHITVKNKGNFTWYPSSDPSHYSIKAQGGLNSINVLTSRIDSCLLLSNDGIKPGESCRLYFIGSNSIDEDELYQIVVNAANSNLSQTTDLGAYAYNKDVLSINSVWDFPSSIIKGQRAYIKVILTNLSDVVQDYNKVDFLTESKEGNIDNDLIDTSASYLQCVTAGSAQLAVGESCYYKIGIDYDALAPLLSDKLKISSVGNTYLIDQTIAFTLLDSQTQTHYLTQAGNPLPILAPGHETRIEIQNISGEVLNGLSVKIPEWAQDIIEHDNSHLLADHNILPGESYIFSFKIKDTAEAMDILKDHESDIANNRDIDNDAFEFNGANVKERIALSSHITPMQLSTSEVAFSKSYKENEMPSGEMVVQLTNLKDATSTYHLELLNGINVESDCDLSEANNISIAGKSVCHISFRALPEAYNQSADDAVVISDPVTGARDSLKITLPKVKLRLINDNDSHMRGEKALLLVENIGEFNWRLSSNGRFGYTLINSRGQTVNSGVKLQSVFDMVDGDCRNISKDFAGVSPDESCVFPIEIESDAKLGSYELIINSAVNLDKDYYFAFNVIKNGAMAMEDVDGNAKIYTKDKPLTLEVGGEIKTIYLKNVGIERISNIQISLDNNAFVIDNTDCLALDAGQACHIDMHTDETTPEDILGALTITADEATPATIAVHLKSVAKENKRWVWLSDLKGTPNLFSWKKSGEYICNSEMSFQDCVNTICSVDPNRPQGENMLTTNYMPNTGDYRAWISSDSRTEPSFNARDNVGLSDMTMTKEYYSLTNDGKLFSTSHDILLGNNLENPLTTQINDNEAWTTSKANGEITTQPYKVSYWNNTDNIYYGQWVADKYKSVEPDRIKVFWEIGTRTSKTDWIWRYGSTVQTDDRWSNDNSASSDTSWNVTGSGYNYALPPTELRHLICFER
ncbi:hypothetical protein [Cysteiniphilum litorale]|uniref:hypothetical protein n=1 Tax=Cysteiniphilum litorale TaxID=2056700 RepID=UPI003F880F0E